ncbi:MAG TPA: gluconate 2-dehydrogenase subunit 3 family protein [Micropepsaceae bacterium]|nr:gluconate 2-dehydrogenase subunit 3 family protein [Micropepsaceae bacterium]
MAEKDLPRRDFLKTAGLGTAAALAGGVTSAAPAKAAAPAPAAEPEIWLTLSPSEQAFVKAAVDTIIPPDELTPSGTDCGLAVFIDRQLAGGFGNGARLYRDGPFMPGKPELGYQLALSPREFFRAGIAAANGWSKKTYGKEFDLITAEQRAAALTAMETGKADFNAGFTSAFFFDNFLQLTMEGFFADPMYGGNKDKVAWKMIGFPGLPANYREEIKTYFNKKYDKGPQSIADFS